MRPWSSAPYATAVLLQQVTRHLYCHCVAWHAQSLVHANGCVASAYETVSSSLNFAVGLIYIRTGSNAVHVQLLRAKNEHGLKEVGEVGQGDVPPCGRAPAALWSG